MENKGKLKMKKFLIIFCFVLMSNSCVNATGLFYTDTTYPITATGAKVQDFSILKKGTSSTNNILYLIEIGDASIDTAAKNGCIKKISYIDIREKSIFIFWKNIKVTVYGE